jgi:hypothetical protein
MCLSVWPASYRRGAATRVEQAPPSPEILRCVHGGNRVAHLLLHHYDKRNVNSGERFTVTIYTEVDSEGNESEDPVQAVITLMR